MWLNWLDENWSEFRRLLGYQYRQIIATCICKWREHNDVHNKIGSYEWGYGICRWFHCTRCGRGGFRQVPDEELLPEERKIKERVEKHYQDNPETYASAMTFRIDWE